MEQMINKKLTSSTLELISKNFQIAAEQTPYQFGISHLRGTFFKSMSTGFRYQISYWYKLERPQIGRDGKTEKEAGWRVIFRNTSTKESLDMSAMDFSNSIKSGKLKINADRDSNLSDQVLSIWLDIDKSSLIGLEMRTNRFTVTKCMFTYLSSLIAGLDSTSDKTYEDCLEKLISIFKEFGLWPKE